LKHRSISTALQALLSRQVTAETLLREALEQAQSHEALDALATFDLNGALAVARKRDEKLACDRASGRLHGIPVTIKDLFAVPGMETRAGTRAPLPQLGKSTAVNRLLEAGAVIIGKANMHEVALGLTGENEWTGDVRNPHDPDRQAGGSSSGSGVAVAAGIGLASLGTDTGGSIRVPAALCGVVAFKPTHRLIPLDGALPLSPTCDHAGPLACSVEDARLLTEVLAGRLLARGRIEAPRLGVPIAYLHGRLTSPIRKEFDKFLGWLDDGGARLIEIKVPDLDLTAVAYTPLVRAEAAHVHRVTLRDAPESFSDPVRRAMESGAATSAGEYLQARDCRRSVIAGLRQTFTNEKIDAILLPATPSEALRLGETNVVLEGGVASHRDAQLALTAPFSLAGVPAACLPFGSIGDLPVGVQVVGQWNADAQTLDVAQWLEDTISSQA
jgi:aspartyl-tRNA(Asn)/glutamyl-tRNA(Gln) amidotransferase subunit A